MNITVLFVLLFWTAAPLALLWIALRFTLALARDFGHLRYILVCVLVPFILMALADLLPEAQPEKYPHLTPAGFYIGIPTLIYFIIANAFLVSNAIFGKRK